MTTPDPANPGSPYPGDQQPYSGYRDPFGTAPAPYGAEPYGAEQAPPLPPVHLEKTPYPTEQYPYPPQQYPTQQYPTQQYPTQQYPGAPQLPNGYTEQTHGQPGFDQYAAGQSPYGQPQFGQPQYGVPGYGQPTAAPFGLDPLTGLPYSDKSKVAAGLLSIFFGYFGIGRFYAGHTGLGITQLAVNIVLSVVTLGLWFFVAWIWPLVDGIVLLTGNPRDQNGRPLR